MDISQCCRFYCAFLEARFGYENASVCTQVDDNLSQCQHMHFCNRSFPMLALNNPSNIESDMMRLHKDINIMSRTDTLNAEIGSGLKSKAPEERSCLLLIFLPAIGHKTYSSCQRVAISVFMHPNMGPSLIRVKLA